MSSTQFPGHKPLPNDPACQWEVDQSDLKEALWSAERRTGSENKQIFKKEK
jgi:hypothetical protein